MREPADEFNHDEASRPTLSRREALQKLAAAGITTFATGFSPAQAGQTSEVHTGSTKGYLQGLARTGGGYAWDAWAEPHLTSTCAVIGAYRLLGQELPDKTRVAQFVRDHHPGRLKKLEQEHREFEFQQIQSLIWLGEDASSFREQVRGWTRPTTYLRQYEQSGHPILRFELAAFLCRELLGLPLGDLAPHYTGYLDSRRRPNGSYNNTPAAEGGDGHAVNTWWGLRALNALGRIQENQGAAIAWLRGCQRPDGGFTWQPDPPFAGQSDVTCTWAAVKGLALLGARPKDGKACAAYLRSLANEDGGYGDRPGWLSSPVATFQALDALQALGEQPSPPTRTSQRANRPTRPPLHDRLQVYSLQLEAHGQGSPRDAVCLAKGLRIHLWGAKNATPGWLETAQRIAQEQGVPVRFFTANEEYGTWLKVPGLGCYSHISDLVAPAGAEIGPSLSAQGPVDWQAFRERRLGPLEKAEGRLVWQFGENEELVRLLLDDSMERGGYACISTFHFGNPDFTQSEPFLRRYRERLPFVALQDAHGPEPWWFADMTTGFRTLFLATEPTWEQWLLALRNHWVAAARHDAVSSHRTWMHGGADQVLRFMIEREAQWRWWDNPAIQRPLVSLVALKPEDEHEAGRPRQGIMIRARCARENTTQGLPRKALAELVDLRLDGVGVTPAWIESKRTTGVVTDCYHQFPMPAPAPGEHRAEVTVRELESGREIREAVTFQA